MMMMKMMHACRVNPLASFFTRVPYAGSQVINGPSSNVMGGRQGCQYEFTATVQGAEHVGWFSWAGTQIDRNDTGSNHLYPEVRATTQWSETWVFAVD